MQFKCSRCGKEEIVSELACAKKYCDRCRLIVNKMMIMERAEIDKQIWNTVTDAEKEEIRKQAIKNANIKLKKEGLM